MTRRTRFLLVLFTLLLAALAGGAYWLHGNLDRLVQQAITRYGSEITGVPVRVAAVQLDAANGRGELRGLRIGNPAGFQTPYAVQADRIELELDLSTLASDVIVIRKIAVIAPDVIYEKGERRTNFDALQAQIAKAVGQSAGAGPGKKLIVQELVVRHARAQASAAFMGGKTVAVDLPDLQLRGLGQAEGGLSPAQLGQRIAGAMEKRLTAAVSFDKLLQSVGGALNRAGEALQGIFK
nr:hypothetical protein [uncultured Rhodoferax sp.]